MKENKLILLTAFLNFISASLKMILGFVFSFSTLIADSIQSFLDFMTDIISLVVNKIGKKRANKTYPFGYGQVYYLSNIFTGVLLLLIGIFLLYQVITLNHKFIPNILILLGLFFVLIIKGVVIFILKKYSSSTKSELLIESYKESTTDFISTCVVLLVLLLSFFEDSIPDFINLDKMGSIGMAIYVFYTAFKMVISNISGILTNDEGNEKLKETIMKELESLKWVRLESIKVIKMSYYYSVFLQIDVNNNIKIKDFLKMEKTIKKRLKSMDKSIKYIDIEPL